MVAAKDLLEGKYSGLGELAPIHMTSACEPMAFVFPDGILVRYDRKENPELSVRVGTIIGAKRDDGTPIGNSLESLAPTLSESFLHCTTDPSTYDPKDQTVTIALSAISGAAGTAHEIAKQRIFAVASLPSKPIEGIKSGISRPIPLVSVRSQFDLLMELELAAGQTGDRKRCLVRSQFRLPVGWEAIELFPPFHAGEWNPDIAEIWAENNLLAAVLQRNMQDRQFQALDPNAEARKGMSKLISDCEKLLDGNEEPLHQFIKSNPVLLSPTRCRMWSKLSLGKRETDFVFREPSGEYLLVELERPSHSLFRNDGQQRQELTHAIDQVIDWRRYIEDNLRTVQTELGLEGISSNPSCLIVIGRSSSLDEAARRKLVALQNSMPKLRIMTYDDLVANAKSVAENILGPLWDPGPNAQVYFLPSAAGN